MTQQRKVGAFRPVAHRPLHIGGAHGSHYNYLFARQTGGDMILRIEDTDSQRFVPEPKTTSTKPSHGSASRSTKAWEGGPLGPYKQSERRDIYREHTRRSARRRQGPT